MPGRLERIVFYETSASISAKEKTKGNRSTKRHTTKGRGGTDNISLWKEVIGMIEAKGLAVSAALDFLAASEILSCFESQEKADLDRIRACIELSKCILRKQLRFPEIAVTHPPDTFGAV
jgi:hypothetical protein